MLYYCPLESYLERYTFQLSAPRTGWLERNWLKWGVEYIRVQGTPHSHTRTMETGVVLDAYSRTEHCFIQTLYLMNLARRGELTSNDVIFFDDFWHPGIESLPYLFDQLGIRPRMYAVCYAQSVDEHDFTHKMKDWMRPFEQGIGKILDGVFVACPMLGRLLVEGGVVPQERVYPTGLIFDSSEVRERMGGVTNARSDRNQVVYTSRWDKEKNPGFFLDVAKYVLAWRPDVEFLVCTSQPELRSNDSNLLRSLHEDILATEGRIDLVEGLSKEDYYLALCQSKIQFNCALQDWVSFTLLEASTAGCYPLYPSYRAFPETFQFQSQYLYNTWDIEHTARKLLAVLDDDSNWSKESLQDRAWIHERFDGTWIRMLDVMGLVPENLKESSEYKAAQEPVFI